MATKTKTTGNGNGNTTLYRKGTLTKPKSTRTEIETKTLDHLLAINLKDIFSAEKLLIEWLPTFTRSVESEELQKEFTHELELTKNRIERLEKVAIRLEINLNEDETSEAMEGLINQLKEIVEKFGDSPVRDSAIIIGFQKIEHYEIAAYNSLRELSDVLGYHKSASTFDRCLHEKEESDHLFTKLAMHLNDEAHETIQHASLEYDYK